MVNSARARSGSEPRLPGLADAAPYSSRLSARSALYTDLRLLLDDREHALASDEWVLAGESSGSADNDQGERE